MGLSQANVDQLRVEIQRAREGDDDKVAMRQINDFLKQTPPIDSNFDSYEQNFVDIFNLCFKKTVPLVEKNPTPAPRDPKPLPKGPQSAWDGYISQKDIDNLLDWSISEGQAFGEMSDRTRKLVLNQGKTQKNISMAHDPPSEAPYKISDVEKKEYSRIVSFNHSRGVDLDSIRDSRNKCDPTCEPREMFKRIVMDQKMEDLKYPASTSTPIKPPRTVKIDDDDAKGINGDAAKINPFFKSPRKIPTSNVAPS